MTEWTRIKISTGEEVETRSMPDKWTPPDVSHKDWLWLRTKRAPEPDYDAKVEKIAVEGKRVGDEWRVTKRAVQLTKAELDEREEAKETEAGARALTPEMKIAKLLLAEAFVSAKRDNQSLTPAAFLERLDAQAASFPDAKFIGVVKSALSDKA